MISGNRSNKEFYQDYTLKMNKVSIEKVLQVIENNIKRIEENDVNKRSDYQNAFLEFFNSLSFLGNDKSSSQWFTLVDFSLDKDQVQKAIFFLLVEFADAMIALHKSACESKDETKMKNLENFLISMNEFVKVIKNSVEQGIIVPETIEKAQQAQRDLDACKLAFNDAKDFEKKHLNSISLTEGLIVGVLGLGVATGYCFALAAFPLVAGVIVLSSIALAAVILVGGACYSYGEHKKEEYRKTESKLKNSATNIFGLFRKEEKEPEVLNGVDPEQPGLSKLNFASA